MEKENIFFFVLRFHFALFKLSSSLLALSKSLLLHETRILLKNPFNVLYKVLHSLEGAKTNRETETVFRNDTTSESGTLQRTGSEGSRKKLSDIDGFYVKEATGIRPRSPSQKAEEEKSVLVANLAYMESAGRIRPTKACRFSAP